MTAPRALTLTPKAHDLLAAMDRQDITGSFKPRVGVCSACGRTAWVWHSGVACIDRNPNGSGRPCPGNGGPPRRVVAA